MGAAFNRVRASEVKVGDTIQHPLWPARFLTVEWIGTNLTVTKIGKPEKTMVHIAGHYQRLLAEEIDREAVSLFADDIVVVVVE